MNLKQQHQRQQQQQHHHQTATSTATEEARHFYALGFKQHRVGGQGSIRPNDYSEGLCGTFDLATLY